MILPRNDVETINYAKLSQSVRNAAGSSAGNVLPSMKTVSFARFVYVKRIDPEQYGDFGLKDFQKFFNS